MEIQIFCSRDNQYRCKNNEYIERNLICDGGKDCSDGTDETIELCKGE